MWQQPLEWSLEALLVLPREPPTILICFVIKSNIACWHSLYLGMKWAPGWYFVVIFSKLPENFSISDLGRYVSYSPMKCSAGNLILGSNRGVYCGCEHRQPLAKMANLKFHDGRSYFKSDIGVGSTGLTHTSIQLKKLHNLSRCPSFC
jgi:hypothetical protein